MGLFKLLIVSVMIMVFVVAPRGECADFSTDLSDVNTEFYRKCYYELGESPINPIGNLGEPLEMVVDIRGFIPLTLVSKAKHGNIRDNDSYFRFPVLLGLAIIYSGVRIDADEYTYKMHLDELNKMPIVKENNAPGEYADWIRLAYTMSKNGKDLFKTIGGNIGYNSTEPILILFTKNNCLIVLSFEYEDFNAKHGQILAAFEFSRIYKEYKKYYDIRNTFFFSKGIRASFSASAPFVLEMLKLSMAN